MCSKQVKIAVDASTADGNPGLTEYRGVDLSTMEELFRVCIGYGTNNIGEFLAIVHALAYCKNNGLYGYIYSDSNIAINWVKKKTCNTTLLINDDSSNAFDLIFRAKRWLVENKITCVVLKWDTKTLGEIPADFGRK